MSVNHDPDFCLDDCCNPVDEKPVEIGDRFLGTSGIQWEVIGFDRSGQGATLSGPEGQIRSMPLDTDGIPLDTRHMTRI